MVAFFFPRHIPPLHPPAGRNPVRPGAWSPIFRRRPFPTLGQEESLRRKAGGRRRSLVP